ncbi:MAG: hypothetical protein ACRDNI_05120 [Gaiellaceae bacterium]
MPPERDPIHDPGALRWVEAGVSGLARPRQWDATALVEVDALRGYETSELEFRVLADGTVLGDVPAEAVPELTAELGLDPPYAARAVRKEGGRWAVGALQIAAEEIELPPGLAASSLEVAVPPDGETAFLVDGEHVDGEPAGDVETAFRELERAGRERFQAFVARADRVGDGRWQLTVDPL